MTEQAVEFAELRWRCRRGMLELDILLNAYLEERFETLSPEQNAAFGAILDYPDQVLFDLLMGNMQSSDARINSLISDIKAASR